MVGKWMQSDDDYDDADDVVPYISDMVMHSGGGRVILSPADMSL